MRPLVLLAVAPALHRGAWALTRGRPGADPGEARVSAEVGVACRAALGLPGCSRDGAASPGCFDYDALAEDMGELGLGAAGCARARPVGARAGGDPLAHDPVEGKVPRAN
ncbi:unnamed protein product, partial [Prorocentrum cordatum]